MVRGGIVHGIVSCSGIVCPLARVPRGHRGVMNAWNLSMEAAPMINRACASYRSAALFYPREKGEGKRSAAGPHGHKGTSSFDELPTVYIAIPPRWQIGSRFYTRNAPPETAREYEIRGPSWKSFPRAFFLSSFFFPSPLSFFTLRAWFFCSRFVLRSLSRQTLAWLRRDGRELKFERF